VWSEIFRNFLNKIGEGAERVTKRLLAPLIVAVFVVGCLVSGANATLITFDSPPAGAGTITGTGTVYLNSYSEAGFDITGNHPANTAYFRSFGSADNTLAGSWAGSRGIVNTYGLTPNPLGGISTLSKTGGGSFSLASVDLSEVTRFSMPTSTTVFTGYLTGGGTATYSATLDGVFGYQTFSFGSLFSDVTSVSWVSLYPSGNTFFMKAQVDNLNVGAPVPIPAAVWLLGSGLLGLLGIRRKILG
jgi:hypothetical protein